MPFVTEMSASSNPVTFTEKSMFTVNLPVAGKLPGLLSVTVSPESAATSVSSSWILMSALNPTVSCMSGRLAVCIVNVNVSSPSWRASGLVSSVSECSMAVDVYVSVPLNAL